MSLIFSLEQLKELASSPANPPVTDQSNPLNHLEEPCDGQCIRVDGLVEHSPHSVAAKMKKPAETLTSAERKELIDCLVKSYGNIPSSEKNRIAEYLDNSRLTPMQAQKYLSAMNEALHCCEESMKPQLCKGFVELINPARKIDLLQRDKDETGNTLLDHVTTIAAISREYMDPRLANRRHEILTSLLNEIADPDTNINQGKDTTCVSTVGQHQLVRNNPAEYARIIREMATSGEARLAEEVGGRVKLSSPGGLTLKLPVDVIGDSEAVAMRSLTERMFQVSAQRAFGGTTGGMYNGQAEQLYEAIFAVPFTRYDSKDFGSFSGNLERCLSEKGANIVSVVWDRTGTGHSNHAIEIVGVENGRVIFRNPWGKEFKELPAGFPAEATDGDKALYSMRLCDLEGRYNWGLVSNERSAVVAFGVTPAAEKLGDGRKATIIFEIASEEPSQEELLSLGQRKKKDIVDTPVALPKDDSEANLKVQDRAVLLNEEVEHVETIGKKKKT